MDSTPAPIDTAPVDVADSTVPAAAPVMVHSAGTQVLDQLGEVLTMRCVNVDGWLTPTPYLVSDAGTALVTSPAEFVDRLSEVVDPARAETFWNDWRDNFITESDFERMGALGFNCVRLVVYYRAIASLEGGTLSFDEARLAYIDEAVKWGEQHGLYVVLDLHAAPGGQNVHSTVSDVPSTDPVARLWEGPEAQANQDATVQIWRHLAERYRDEQWVAGYDLLNEPELPAGTDASTLVGLYERIIAAIREVDSNHMVIVEGDNLATDVSVFDAPLDANMMYEFHAYALTGFEDWATPEATDLEPYLTLRDQHDRPIWLGEFGEGTQDWIAQMIGLMETNDVGWALYPWKRKQTLFWVPVIQRIDDMPQWYRLAAYLARPAGDTGAPPSVADAEAGMAEVLAKMQLSANTQDDSFVAAIAASLSDQ